MLDLQIIYQDDYSGMCTYHAEFQIDRGMNYDAAVKVLEQEVLFLTQQLNQAWQLHCPAFFFVFSCMLMSPSIESKPLCLTWLAADSGIACRIMTCVHYDIASITPCSFGGPIVRMSLLQEKASNRVIGTDSPVIVSHNRQAVTCHCMWQVTSKHQALLHSVHILCVLKRKEDPNTLSGFYRQKVEHTGRIYHVLALPRDAQGRKLKKNAFAKRGGNRAAYYRVMRPASGFSSTDYDAESAFRASCTNLESQWQILWQNSLGLSSQTSEKCVACQDSTIGACSGSSKGANLQ